jgi:hypothetical protein
MYKICFQIARSEAQTSEQFENIFCTCIYKNQYPEVNKKKIIKDIFDLRTMYDTDYIINILI